MAEERNLPGTPSKLLVRKVKRILYSYTRSRPQPSDKCWRLAWEWAGHEAESSVAYRAGVYRRKKWPVPHEIASRYLLLCLIEMKSSSLLNVGYKAAESRPLPVLEFMSDNTRRLAHVSDDFGIQQLEPDPLLIETA